jgi:hypothetical protein
MALQLVIFTMCNIKPKRELAPALALNIPMNETMIRDEIMGRTKCEHDRSN